MTLVQGATKETLTGLAVPNCKKYHRWHNTRLKGKGLRDEDSGKEKREGINAKRKNQEKTTLRNITIKLNVESNSSRPSTYANERISSNVVIVLRRQCDDGWTKKLGVCAKSTTVRQVMMSSMSISKTKKPKVVYLALFLGRRHRSPGDLDAAAQPSPQSPFHKFIVGVAGRPRNKCTIPLLDNKGLFVHVDMRR